MKIITIQGGGVNMPATKRGRPFEENSRNIRLDIRVIKDELNLCLSLDRLVPMEVKRKPKSNEKFHKGGL